MEYQHQNLNLKSTEADDTEVKYIETILRKDFNLYETPEESKKREEIVVSLNNCAKEAVKNLFKNKKNQMKKQIVQEGRYSLLAPIGWA